MFDDRRSFVSRAFLRAELELDFRAWREDGRDNDLLTRLRAWDTRVQALTETQAEGAFTQTFFVDTWGYGESGRVPANEHTIIPKLGIPGEGAGGGPGEADLALGWFRGDSTATPQVICEFKDIRSRLDEKQNRKGNNRSPVQQCLNYLRGVRRSLFGHEPTQPWWGLVTDMNEFRLYWADRGPAEYMRFVLRKRDILDGEYDLLSDSEDAQFDRFLFSRLFGRDFLMAEVGKPPLLRLIERQWTREERLEGEFYARYRAVRERLFNVIRANNADFAGTPTDLLRLTQSLLDRFIFAFYCEDMGERMLFPPQMIRDHMKSRSIEPYYDPNGAEFWGFFTRLFRHMNEGGMFGGLRVPHINGGLFAPNAAMDALSVPNHFFAAVGQGANDATLESESDTLLYLCARYNYAARGDVRESLSLYTLGRIFEQSITELEYRQGELEGRDSIAKLSKRKRDGVYYTPEWVVNLLVEETLTPWFAAARRAAGYDEHDEEAQPGAAEAYLDRVKRIRIVDPACGSGAFLISAFRRLLQERMSAERAVEIKRSRGGAPALGEATLIGEILASNIYGVDINPASVEITKLALWLHSARAESPLSSLDHTIRCGNSLVSHDFWSGREVLRDREDRVNSFDWRETFPEVWPDGEDGGFDIVLGNPPYVKLQNLMKVDPEVVAYLGANRGDDTYVSAQTGNIDLYLPFIEKGLRLLGPGGRMAYIAPSLWAVNEYGEGLRRHVRRTHQLWRWIDFKAYQVFDEAITYTALQFFTREPNNAIRIATAPKGESEAQDIDWTDEKLAVPYEAMPEDGAWLMATGPEKALVERLARDCLRLDDPSLTTAIFQGLITSADYIYHLARLGDGRYLCSPRGQAPYEVQVEDEVMRPLVSGPEAKRYEEPETTTYILFPYERDDAGRMPLIAAADLERRFPLAWSYLTSWEDELRARESNGFNDDRWHRFGRSQNIDKQNLAKLIVAQTVPELRISADFAGAEYLNNVRVNGILCRNDTDLAYLLGVMNGAVANFVFKRQTKAGWLVRGQQAVHRTASRARCLSRGSCRCGVPRPGTSAPLDRSSRPADRRRGAAFRPRTRQSPASMALARPADERRPDRAGATRPAL